MPIKIKTEEITKVVERQMHIGNTKYEWGRTIFKHEDAEGVKRLVYIGDMDFTILGHHARIHKGELGWGCHRVSPKQFRQVLKNLKSNEPFQFKREDDGDICSINLRSLVKVVRVYGQSVPKKELIEKMEILLQAHSFLYKK